MTLKKVVLFSSIFLITQCTWGQTFLHKRLTNVQQKSPEKLEKTATRYTKLFPKHPSAYFFLAKNNYAQFQLSNKDQDKSRFIYRSLKFARKAQKLDEKSLLIVREEWLNLKESLKYEAFFYPKETSFKNDNEKIQKEYYSFISNGEDEYVSESALNLVVPEEQRNDSLFYGLPSGKEVVERNFVKEETKMLQLINDEREKLGLPIMQLDSSLSVACRYHAYDMGTQNYFSHTGRDLGTDGREYFANYTFDRIRQFYNKSKILGENISWGRQSAEQTYKGWYNSSGHNKIMFHPDNRLVGIGIIQIAGSDKEFYWVLCTAE